MKKINLSITYNEEKLAALRVFLEQKDSTLEGELAAVLNILFKKHVPNSVREFIELKGTNKTKGKKGESHDPSEIRG
ncbi:MAG: DUF6103 family protein [Oscillospiraceae bacterium]|nr:DUF6103 family protein [Oscillospiraceae bacterium]